MSNDQELFELCKEVYKKVGWGLEKVDLDFYFDEYGLLRSRFQVLSITKWGLPTGYVPVYTSDYLLEKLPKKVTLNVLEKVMDYEKWSVASWTGISDIVECGADTPLKALLRLTLALKESGEL